MKNMRFCCCFLVAVWTILYAVSVNAKSEASPHISSGSCGNVQNDILSFAKKAYDSTVFDLRDYQSLEKQLIDLSSKTSILSENLIEKKKVIVSEKSIEFSWPKKMTENQYMFIKTRQPFNWAGDWYALYWGPTFDLPVMVGDTKVILGANGTLPYQILQNDLWQQPFFIHIKDKNTFVGVIPNHPADPISEWTIYVPSGNKELTTCQVQFYSGTTTLNSLDIKNKVTNVASEFFPKQGTMYTLITVLDDILGPGTNEGTLHQTQGIRNNICQLIMNIALRPWVIADMDKKSEGKEKSTIDKNLEKWASKNPSFLKQYQLLKRLYLLAEKELEEYYQTHFDETQERAKFLAKASLEILYVSYFHFPSSQE